MRGRLFSLGFGLLAVCAGCNAILGNDEHPLVVPLSAALPDAGEAGSPGGAVTPTSGGIYSVGRVPHDGGVAVMRDGMVVSVVDDGFELGETLCSGTVCVTGGIVP
jgi:hypothetical protein